MKFEDGRIQGFELKFKSVEEDTERYLFALVDLLDAGEIEVPPGRSLHNTHYDDLVGEVRDYLGSRVAYARQRGVAGSHIAVDPGIGFGKSAAGNRELIRRAGELAVDGCPVVVGASRKSFIW